MKNTLTKNIKEGDEVIVKIHYSAIATLCMRWVYYDRPCNLYIKPSKKNHELIGICFKIENEVCLYFLNQILKDIDNSEVFIKGTN